MEGRPPKGFIGPKTVDGLDYAPNPVVQPKVCPACSRSLPVAEFKRLPGDGRCEGCVKQAEREREEELKATDVKRVAAQLLDSVDKGGGGGAPTLDEMLEAVMDEFGGYRVFAHEWVKQIKISFEKFPGRVGNLQQAAQIAKLIGASDRNQTTRDVASMTDEQLAKERELALMQMLSDTMADDKRSSMIAMLCRHQGMNPAELIANVTRPAEEDAL